MLISTYFRVPRVRSTQMIHRQRATVDGTKPRGQKERKEELQPLTSAASLTPPQLPFGNITPRNNFLASAATSAVPASHGGQTPRHNSLEKAATSAAPASLGGQNPEDQRRASPGGRNPGNRRRAFLGGRNPRDNNNRQCPSFKGAVKKKTTTTKMTPNHQV